MEYRLKIGERTFDCKVDERSDAAARISCDGKAHALKFLRIDDQRISITVDGRQMTALIEKNGQGKTVTLNGRRYAVLDKDALERAGSRKTTGAGDQGPGIVTPPMPAIVIRVAVSEGDRVEKGDTVAVVSAMKMESSLTAPHAGRVTGINCKEGDKVMPGDVLVDIDTTGEEEAV